MKSRPQNYKGDVGARLPPGHAIKEDYALLTGLSDKHRRQLSEVVDLREFGTRKIRHFCICPRRVTQSSIDPTDRTTDNVIYCSKFDIGFNKAIRRSRSMDDRRSKLRGISKQTNKQFSLLIGAFSTYTRGRSRRLQNGRAQRSRNLSNFGALREMEKNSIGGYVGAVGTQLNIEISCAKKKFLLST